MNRERFSQEIFDAFIDNFSDSLVDLKILALVAKSWLPRTRKHIFRRLRIRRKIASADQKAEILDSFAHLLRTPEIVRCVKVVIIDEKLETTQLQLAGAPVASLGQIPGMFGPGGLNFVLAAQATQAQWAQWGALGASGGENFFPCSLNVLQQLKDAHSLSYQWGTSDRILSAQSGTEFVTAFAGILRNFDSGLKYLYLKDTNVVFPNKPYKRQAPSLDPFEVLAAFAPSLETLCLCGILSSPNGVRYSHNLDGLRHILKKPSTAYGKAAGERKIYLTRFCCFQEYQHHPDMAYNSVLNVLLFENRFLNYSNLVYLAIESQYIPLFVNRPSALRHVKHLTLINPKPFVHLNQITHAQWNYNRARLSLPSLTTLQLVVSEDESMLTLCRAILGPQPLEAATPSEHGGNFSAIMGMEFPGDHLYVGESPTHKPPYPEAGSGLCLHIEFPSENWLVNMSKSARTDAILHSYLNLDSLESCGPLERITVNRSEVFILWPKTAGSGRLSQRGGNIWWDVNDW